MWDNAALTGGSSRAVTLSGSFSFSQTDGANWNSGRGFRLVMNGPSHYLEIGGKDDGAIVAGFTSNFHLEKLSIQGSLTDACLVDLINNGNRGGTAGLAEALYVDSTVGLNNRRLTPGGTGYTMILNAINHTWFSGVVTAGKFF
jgi:hypothetical protein